MLAVHTSDLERLPHQTQAVYGELLDCTPLRYPLADDPDAGKTIMAGLYIKELMLRGHPGTLPGRGAQWPNGQQWQDEPREKFDLSIELLTRQLADAQPDGTVFARYPLLIARMDRQRAEEDRAVPARELLGRHARNLLPMTATPHAGKEEGRRRSCGLAAHGRIIAP